MEHLLTEREALGKTIAMWTWVAENCRKQKKPVSKQEWIRQNETEYVHSNCYLCEYGCQALNERNGRISPCKGGCLIGNWSLTKPDRCVYCIDIRSPYHWYQMLLDTPIHYKNLMESADDSLLACEQALDLMPKDPAWKKAAAYADAVVHLAQEALDRLNQKTKEKRASTTHD